MAVEQNIIDFYFEKEDYQKLAEALRLMVDRDVQEFHVQKHYCNNGASILRAFNAPDELVIHISIVMDISSKLISGSLPAGLE